MSRQTSRRLPSRIRTIGRLARNKRRKHLQDASRELFTCYAPERWLTHMISLDGAAEARNSELYWAAQKAVKS